eukprot:jgi/Psemu1/35825/gm1.35825_g
MPGIFSTCIISTRPGLSHGDRRARQRRRPLGFDNSISVGSTASHSGSMSSSNDSEGLSQCNNNNNNNNKRRKSQIGRSETEAVVRLAYDGASSRRGFYSNKDNKAMIFVTNHDQGREDGLGLRSEQRPNSHDRQRKRHHLIERSSGPCEWGYFVDTAV